MGAVALIVRPTPDGWGVYLTNGQELARYRGPASKWRALRYLAAASGATSRPDIRPR